MRVLVLKGGNSSEREISLRSARSITAALKSAGHQPTEIDSIKGVDTISFSGFDMVFPILHGSNGEDGVLQKQFELKGLSFLGTGSLSSKKSFDKVKTHKILQDAGIKMPNYQVVDSNDMKTAQLAKSPYVLKTICGGSSVDIVLARKLTAASAHKSKTMLDKHKKMLLEELISGQEITVGILDGEPLPVIAINPPKGKDFDYENKYNGLSDEVCPVPSSVLSTELQKAAQGIALNVHKTLGAKHLSRVDMIVANDGDIYVLELNTMPGMTEQSLFPKAADQAGYSMSQLAQKFVELVRAENK